MATETPLDVLLVEDSPTDVLLTEEALAQASRFRLRSRERLGEVLRLLWSGESVTVRSVPMPASGSSVFFCARSSPFERLAIAITSATPSPSPSSVTIVRVRRRSSSRRT